MDNSLIIFGGLFILSVLFSKISDKYGVPALLMFLAIGMLAGSDLHIIGNCYFTQSVCQIL